MENIDDATAERALNYIETITNEPTSTEEKRRSLHDWAEAVSELTTIA